MTPVEIETAARSVLHDFLDAGIDITWVLENDDVPEDVSDEELEKIIKQIRKRLGLLSLTNNDME